MIHRACNLPLSEESFKREVEYIKETACVNGYSKDIVERLLKKHLRKRQISNITTLSPIEETEKLRWAGLVYHPSLSYKIANVLQKHAIRAAPRTTGKLSQLLGNPKDAIDDHKKSGIYKICCQTCPALYIGQTKRNIGQRFKEHLAHVPKNEVEKSSVAKHLINNPNHVTTSDNISLLRPKTGG